MSASGGAGIFLLGPVLADPFASIVQDTVLRRIGQLRLTAKEGHNVSTAVESHSMKNARLRTGLRNLGPVLPVPLPGVADGSIRSQAAEEHQPITVAIIGHRELLSWSGSDVVDLSPVA